jgi:hypothetical protein
MPNEPKPGKKDPPNEKKNPPPEKPRIERDPMSDRTSGAEEKMPPTPRKP